MFDDKDGDDSQNGKKKATEYEEISENIEKHKQNIISINSLNRVDEIPPCQLQDDSDALTEDQVEVFLTEANVYLRYGLIDKAAEYIRLVLKYFPTNHEAIRLNSLLKEEHESIPDFKYSSNEEEVTQEDIDKANRALDAEGNFIKAEALIKKGNFKDAQPFIEKSIRLNPEEPEYYVYLGWCQFKNSCGKNIKHAKETIQKALDMGLSDRKDVAYVYLGILAKSEKLPAPEQRKYFNKAIEENPQNSLARNELLLLDRNLKIIREENND